MVSTEARNETNARTWRNVLTGAASIAAIAAVCWLIRGVGPAKAVAQQPAPAFRVAPAAKVNSNVQPAAPTAKSNAVAPQPATVAKGGTTSAPTINVKEMKIMAVVNGEQIKQSDLGFECLKRYGEEVLESMVNRALIQQACKKHGVTISEQDITDEIQTTASKFGLSVDRWVALLKEERGVTDEQYRSEIIWPTVALRRLAAERLNVTQEDLQRAFETEHGPQVRVRMICTTSEAKAREAAAKAKADPVGFADLSKKYSDDPNIASVGGMIPPIRRHLGDAELERIAFSLREGQVSDVIRAHDQFFVLKCEGHVAARIVPPQDRKQEEARLADRIRDQKLRGASQDLFKQLQEQAKVVNVMNDPKLKAQYPGTAALIDQQPITIAVLTAECLERHGKEVLEGEINRLILTQELKKRNEMVKETDLNAEVARAAVAYNCVKPDGAPDVDKWLKQVLEQDGTTVELYIRDAVWPSVALKKLVREKSEITEEELKKGFESNYGPRVEVLAIVLSDQRQAQRVWDMARNNPTDVFFGQLAAQYSVEPVSRSNSGKVPPVRKFGGQPLVEEAAFKLKPGELSGIVTIGEKSIIMRCLGRTQPVVEKFEDVRAQLAADIQEKKTSSAMNKEFERLREGSQIDNFLAGTSQSGKKLLSPSIAPVSGTTPGSVAPAAANQRLGTAPRTNLK